MKSGMSAWSGKEAVENTAERKPNMKTYITKSGDMWDSIAHEQMGDTAYTNLLMQENLEHRNIFIFPSGIKLNIPDGKVEVNSLLPPWKRGEV